MNLSKYDSRHILLGIYRCTFSQKKTQPEVILGHYCQELPDRQRKSIPHYTIPVHYV